MKSGTTIFQHFKVNLIIRFVILFLLLFGLSWVILKTDLWTLVIWVGLAIFFWIIEFFRFVEKFKNNFIFFLESVNQGDFTVNFNLKQMQKTDKRYGEILNELMEKFRILRAEKQMRHMYLNAIVEQVNVGLISYDKDGTVTLINEAAKKLLGRPFIKNMDNIRKCDEGLYNEILKLESGKRSLYRYARNEEMLQLSLEVSELKLDQDVTKIITLQDIKNELDEREVESWQKLIRILNHEIMNSVIPLGTLTRVNREILQKHCDDLASSDGKVEIKLDKLRDVVEGMKVIEQRSSGITTFVKATKSITGLPKPVFKKVNLSDILERIKMLFNQELVNMGIKLTIICPDNVILTADMELFEQVLINLVKNAREALTISEGIDPEIQIKVEKYPDHVLIRVIDNGNGIDPELFDQIFIPFFTTHRDGTGIGLAISKQIMRMHKGSIEVNSKPGRTEFLLKM